MGVVFSKFEPDHQDQGTVARLIRHWEETLARKTKSAGALSLTAVSLAACGGDDDGGDDGGEVAAFNFAALENVAGDAAEIFIPWFEGEEGDEDEGDGSAPVADGGGSGQDAPVDGGGNDAPVGGGDAPVAGGDGPVGGQDDDNETGGDGDGDFPGFDIILADLFSNFGTPAEGALTADLVGPAGPIFQADLGLLDDNAFEEFIETFGKGAVSDDYEEGPAGFEIPEVIAQALDETIDDGLLTPDMMPPLGFKVWHYDPGTGPVDLTDGVGDPGPGLGDPNNRYPWSFEMFAAEEGSEALFVGAMNSNPFPINVFYNLAEWAGSGFVDYPGYPTTYTTGPEIWRWMPDEIAAAAGGLEVAQAPSPDGGSWERVLDADDLPGLDGQVGIRELHAHDDGYLYAATSNTHVPLLIQGSQDRASLIRTMDGVNWDFVPTDPGFGNDPFDNPGLSSIRTLESHDSKLFVGTEVGGNLLAILADVDLPPTPDFLKPGLWFYEEGNTWTQVTEGAPINGLAISEILSFDSIGEDPIGPETPEVLSNSIGEDPILYFGTYGTEGSKLYEVRELETAPPPGHSGYEIFDVSPEKVSFLDLYDGNLDGNVTAIPDYVDDLILPPIDGKYDNSYFTDDVSPFDDFGVLKLFEFDGYMYLSGVDYFDGATLMRSMNPADPHSWELLTADGFVTELGALNAGAADLLGGNVPIFKGNFYFWSATVVGDEGHFGGSNAPSALDAAPISEPTLFLGTFNGVAGAGQVFRITHANDGSDTPLIANVTGATTGAPEGIYGIRSAESTEADTLFFGGASNAVLPDLFSDPYPVVLDV